MNNGGRKEFWWEREWRHVGDFRFEEPRDIVVAFPQGDHNAFRDDLTSVLQQRQEGSDPFVPAGDLPPVEVDGYKSLRLVDPNWGLERMIAALAGVGDPGPFPS
ncbi:hypothetical protein GCM10023224_14080 [Streptomonospora halophila]|uniref:Uncharacterized protein n=2 Tax=Streptomonospora halophila TaxID=427369 RepID=A0ABP9GAR6_9ACTN